MPSTTSVLQTSLGLTMAARPATVVERGLPQIVLSAAVVGNTQAVAAWLNGGGGVDARCAELHGATLLMAAAIGGQKALVGCCCSAARASTCKTPTASPP